MVLLVGLGNPGPKYAGHRHNVGFMAIDAIAEAHGFGPFRKKFQGEIADGRLGDAPARLLKPLTFMNESGRSAGEAARFFKIPNDQIIVFYDELDLAPGKVRVKRGGGAAGHNGIRSLHAHLGPDYKRVRIGIGHPGAKPKVIGHVLGDFSKADQDWLPDLLNAIAAAAPHLAAGADDKFQTDIAHRAPAPRAAAEDAPRTLPTALPPREPAAPATPAAPAAQSRDGVRSPSSSPFDALKGLLGKRD